MSSLVARAARRLALPRPSGVYPAACAVVPVMTALGRGPGDHAQPLAWTHNAGACVSAAGWGRSADRGAAAGGGPAAASAGPGPAAESLAAWAAGGGLVDCPLLFGRGCAGGGLAGPARVAVAFATAHATALSALGVAPWARIEGPMTPPPFEAPPGFWWEVLAPAADPAASPMLAHTKRTFQPSTLVRKRRHGFLTRMATANGRRIIVRRLHKGRRKLSA